jgi:DNA-binding helix-turn-helix protein
MGKDTILRKILRKKRIDIGITQEKMAQELGISNAMMSNLELGKSTSERLLIAIVQKYNISADEFVEIAWEYFLNTRRIIGLPKIPKSHENKLKTCLSEMIKADFEQIKN